MLLLMLMLMVVYYDPGVSDTDSAVDLQKELTCDTATAWQRGGGLYGLQMRR